jgi:hypothetical protein
MQQRQSESWLTYKKLNQRINAEFFVHSALLTDVEWLSILPVT